MPVFVTQPLDVYKRQMYPCAAVLKYQFFRRRFLQISPLAEGSYQVEETPSGYFPHCYQLQLSLIHI